MHIVSFTENKKSEQIFLHLVIITLLRSRHLPIWLWFTWHTWEITSMPWRHLWLDAWLDLWLDDRTTCSWTWTRQEFMQCTTSHRKHHLPTTDIKVNLTQVTPSTSVRIFTNLDLVMRTHVQRTVSRCFTTLRQLRSILRSVSLSTSTMQTLVVRWVLDQLDYRITILVGLLIYQQRRLESGLNSSAS